MANVAIDMLLKMFILRLLFASQFTVIIIVKILSFRKAWSPIC